MRIIPSRALSLALLAAVALPLSACATNRAKGDTPYIARDVGTLYSAAKQRLDQGDYKVAAALFDEVERQHPYSIWARRARWSRACSRTSGSLAACAPLPDTPRSAPTTTGRPVSGGAPG